MMITRPESNEYASHSSVYIHRVPEGDLLSLLNQQLEGTLSLVRNLTDEEAGYRYAPGKWSIKQMLGHMADTERIMSYRLLRIARGDRTALAGFKEDDYVDGASFDSAELKDLLADLTIVRSATLSLLNALAPEAFLRLGIVNNHDISVRAIAYIITGHELHHRHVLVERYLTQVKDQA
jgi:uncharacterized damage-inducible protein DinB